MSPQDAVETSLLISIIIIIIGIVLIIYCVSDRNLECSQGENVYMHLVHMKAGTHLMLAFNTPGYHFVCLCIKLCLH